MEPNTQPLRKDSTDSDPSINSIGAGIDSIEVHCVPVTSCYPSAMSWSDSLVADSLASSIVKGGACENVVKHQPDDVVRLSNSLFLFPVDNDVVVGYGI